MTLFGQELKSAKFSNEVKKQQQDAVTFWKGYKSFVIKDLKKGIVTDSLIKWVGRKAAKKLLKIHSK